MRFSRELPQIIEVDLKLYISVERHLLRQILHCQKVTTFDVETMDELHPSAS